MIIAKSQSIQVSKEIQLDYGHTLPNHFSYCNQFHGHRARVVAHVEGEICTKPGDSSEGMVMDFRFLKQALMSFVHDKLDHGFAIWKDDPDRDFIIRRNERFIITDKPPTAEYLAQWAFGQLNPHIPKGLTLVSVEWWETPTSCATCTARN